MQQQQKQRRLVDHVQLPPLLLAIIAIKMVAIILLSFSLFSLFFFLFFTSLKQWRLVGTHMHTHNLETNVFCCDSNYKFCAAARVAACAV